jgi:hypothetical protein
MGLLWGKKNYYVCVLFKTVSQYTHRFSASTLPLRPKSVGWNIHYGLAVGDTLPNFSLLILLC